MASICLRQEEATKGAVCRRPGKMLAERQEQIDVEEERTGRPSSWNLVYGLMRCKVRSCTLKSHCCWDDSTDKKHYKFRSPYLGRLADYVDGGGNLESHDDVPIAFGNILHHSVARLWILSSCSSTACYRTSFMFMAIRELWRQGEFRGICRTVALRIILE
jgi:hypothetical protein